MADLLSRAGVWAGDLAAALGLAGEVRRGELAAMLAGRHPRSGAPLGGAGGLGGGWDLQFVPPESVTVLWAVAEAAVGEHVERAIGAAVVDGALRYLQDHGTFASTGGAARGIVRAEGLIGAVYRADPVRNAVPACDVNVIVAALTRAGGHWWPLDEQGLRQHQYTADCVFESHLRAELTERLGVRWVAGLRCGRYEIDGIPRAARDALLRPPDPGAGGVTISPLPGDGPL